MNTMPQLYLHIALCTIGGTTENVFQTQQIHLFVYIFDQITTFNTFLIRESFQQMHIF